MIRKHDGFTMVELMITMVIFVVAIAAASNIFTGLLTQFKQQSSIAETNIQGIVGLEMMRSDIEQAGFGLPWDMNGLSYNEASAVKYDSSKAITADTYNDLGNPPRAVVVGSGPLMNGSEVLVIKATNVATNAAAYRWTYMVNAGGVTNAPMAWGPSDDNLADGDCVLVMTGTSRKLAKDLTSPSFYAEFHTLTSAWPTGLLPANNTFNLIYGIKDDCAAQAPRTPFNRADYYIKQPSTGMPSRCAPGTGVLYKGTLNHADGGLSELPLMDCVADMQIVLGLDTHNNGVDTYQYGSWPAVGSTAAQTVRDQLKEVRVYLVVQEGRKDPSYIYKNPTDGTQTITVTDPNYGTLNTLTLATMGADDIHYRWRIYTMVIKPYNLR
jgi:prepilin-type N-terminal cleavage/methylation domain-containing protein